jgi:hypothetical protein
MAGLGGTGPPVTVSLEVIGDYTKEELEAAEAASQLSSEPCQHRMSSGESSLASRTSQGATSITSKGFRQHVPLGSMKCRDLRVRRHQQRPVGSAGHTEVPSDLCSC